MELLTVVHVQLERAEELLVVVHDQLLERLVELLAVVNVQLLEQGLGTFSFFLLAVDCVHGLCSVCHSHTAGWPDDFGWKSPNFSQNIPRLFPNFPLHKLPKI